MITWQTVRHFREAEFRCKCCERSMIQAPIVRALDDLREAYGRPIYVTSGYRCPAHNMRVSSTGRNGPHTTGLAVDIAATGREAHELLTLACISRKFCGIGVQQKGGGRFIHLDMIPDSESHRRPWVWSY